MTYVRSFNILMSDIFMSLDTDTSNACNGYPSVDWNCCSDAFPCMVGGGDCDEDSHCAADLVCGSDNCYRDFSSTGSNWVTGADCCTSI